MSAIDFLEEDDPVRQIAIIAVIEQRAEMEATLRKDQAVRIGNAVGKALGG
jgi:hypothetical protein